jgi:antitoxin MazE
MVTRIQRWGNSQGVRLSKELISTAGLQVGDTVEITVRDGELVVSPFRPPRGKLDLADLVKQIPDDYSPEELDWGFPAGREAW